ncbi:MAG: flgM [Polaromonas sp.]|jgi:negative regulator of flagellin synthesis FlgM|nr:flgM [Polaromonas sp.]MDB5844794.1 flgM [Polaromonas sp.]
MKINQNVTFIKTGAPAPAVASGKGSAVAGASAAQAPAAASQARLPSTTGDFDAARVAEIRESIRAGRYQVDTAKIADGLISSVRDLLGKNSS